MPSSRRKAKKPSANEVLKNVQTTRTPYFRVVYSNLLKPSSSPVEMRLTFSHIVDQQGQPPSNIVEDEICVCVHPAIMKVMLAQLDAMLKNHEKLWGQISLPNGIRIPTEEELTPHVSGTSK